MKFKKTKIFSAIYLALVLVLAGCGSNNSSSGNDNNNKDKHYTFALITQAAVPFYIAVEEGAKAAAKELGNVTITAQAPQSMTDLAGELSMFNNAVTTKVDGILLAPQSPTQFVRPVEKAIKNGIPVITVDTGVEPHVANSFIATSNSGAAKELAQHMGKLIEEKGKVAIINFNNEASTAIEREKGWKEGIQSFPGIESLGTQYPNNDPGVAQSQAANFYQQNKDLKLIYATNDLTSNGVANFIKKANLKDSVFLAGFDVNLGMAENIKAGIIDASVLQSPYEIGYRAVMTMMKIKAGEEVEKVIHTPVFILTPDNIDTPEAIKAIKQYEPDYEG